MGNSFWKFCWFTIISLALVTHLPAESAVVKNVTVCLEEGRYGGWPANHGIWNWGNEILVGFELGHFKASEERHAIDRTRFREHLLARSLDGGESWSVERPAALIPPAPETEVTETGIRLGKKPRKFKGKIPFQHPGFLLTARRMGGSTGPSRFYYSLDRGREWEGPFEFPDLGTPGIAARTDYIVESNDELSIFLTSAKSDGTEGRALCARTFDGGRSWSRIAFIGPEYEDREFLIMPSTVRLSRSELFTAVRLRSSIDTYRSLDNGYTWEFCGKAVDDTGRGNPPDMLKLYDGRLVLVYGYRAEPYGIRARVSEDGGRTWGPEIILRDDGGNWDVGYPRTVQRPDGKLVTVYYFNDPSRGERYIDATIWDPGAMAE